MIGQKEFKRSACQSLSNFAFGMDDHIFFDWLSAGSDGLYPSFDLHKTETAGGWGVRLFTNGTEVGNVDAILQGSEEDVLSLAGFYLLSVNGQSYFDQVFLWELVSRRLRFRLRFRKMFYLNLNLNLTICYFDFGT
jgi:hypothetical protein